MPQHADVHQPDEAASPDGDGFVNDRELVRRVLAHVVAGTTDVAEPWREPVVNYLDERRFEAERSVLCSTPSLFAPSAAVAAEGDYFARNVAGVPLLATRGRDGRVRVFRNACRHRGATLVDGGGCRRALVCGYHGWTYRLDGTLATVPRRDGFPPIDPADHSLVEVDSAEANGLVIVGALDGNPDSAAPAASTLASPELRVAPQLDGHRMLEWRQSALPLNWKVLVEQFLEGYHIRHAHRDTFFPLQYDNLNVVETYGPHSRVTFPYRAIERLANRPQSSWDLRRRATLVYHLFPTGLIATFPDRTFVLTVDPTTIDQTTLTTFVVSDRPEVGGAADIDPAETDLLQRGIVEDNTMSLAVQRGLASGANRELLFGPYEGALTHFHRHLDKRVRGSVRSLV